MVVKVIFQNQQLEIFQGSKIKICGKLEDHQLGKTFVARFDKSGFTFFPKFLPSSLPRICKHFFRHFMTYNLHIYLTLLLLEN